MGTENSQKKKENIDTVNLLIIMNIVIIENRRKLTRTWI